MHGTGFRDRERIKYWGRIPATLEAHGAVVRYGHQDSWGSIEHNAETLKANLQKILDETGSEKVNIIAHSKGGLDARCLISSLGMADKVASLTTIATPHHGSRTIDFFCRFPRWTFRIIAFFIDSFSRLLGDEKPDFYTASRGLSTACMDIFNENNPDAPSVYYQSYAAVMKKPSSDIFLWFSFLVVKAIEGENDGLVTPESAAWTHFQGTLRAVLRHGASHTDVIDFLRKDYPITLSENSVFNIREFYVHLVSGLKQSGL